ncbi:hypothetical protein BESB_006290 [Besnoitia besnoiti]|uniref:Uncharacterized protein n=1 Tax=Besnoitia besnoiti TaxID=94643 RepID=A0A2A9MIC5_BESBE|nr:hypothetical protein BESB_006290 [Besnoitia besnoiti]PFH38288.1 hypothetical protein BESB_006290 [Besnoitia besnoiti]
MLSSRGAAGPTTRSSASRLATRGFCGFRFVGVEWAVTRSVQQLGSRLWTAAAERAVPFMAESCERFVWRAPPCQVLAALRSELTSEHENRQVLLQILELYAPEVVTELRQRMQKPPPSTFPSLCLDSCGSGAPGALSEKFGSPSSAASPRAALTGRRSPFKAESLCRAPLRHAAHAGLDPREAHSRPFAAKESPGVPQVSAAHASQLNVATGSVAPCPTESPDASPTDRLRLLRRRGLLCGFAYGALNSECLPGGDASAPTPLEAGSGGSASSAAPAPDTARVREVPWNGSAAAPQWRPPPSNAEAPSRSPHMEAWAGGQTIPRSSLGTPCVACRPPPHRAAACHANCGCSAQSPLVSRELVSRGEPVIGRDAEGTPAAACQQEMENRESLKSRGNACNAPEVDGMTYMHARRPPREASRASCDGLAFIKPMSPPTPHCEPVARLALFEELERCCAPDGLAAVSQPLPRQCFPVEGRHGDAAPLEPNGCDAIRLTGDLESPSMINRGLRLLPAEPPLPPAEPEEEQTNTRGYLQASPERKTSKPPLFRNEDLSSKPRRLVQAATPLVGGGMQSPHTLSPAAPVAAGNRAMDGRALYRQGYTAGLPLQSCEAEVSLPSVRVRGTARKSAACGLDAEVAAPDADRGCQGDDAGALMQGTFGLKTKEKEASGVSRSEAQQVWLENPNLALGAARTCSSPPIASSRQGLSSLETSRQDGTPSINVRRGAPFAEELRVAERAAMREPVSGTPCGAKAEKGGREAVDETPVAGNKLGVSKLEPHGLSSTPLTRSPSAAPSVTSAALPFAESSQTSPPPCNPLSRSPEADSVDIGLSEDSQSASPLLLEARAANSSSSPLTQNWAELTRNSDEPGWSRQIEVASRGFRLSDLNEGRRCSDGQKGSNTSPDLRQRVRAGAARTIQKRWRLYKARKMVSSSVSQSCLAACASLLHDRGSPPVSRPANDRALLKCRTLEPRRCHSGWTGQSPEMTPNPIPPPEGKSPVTPQRQTESLRAPDSSPTTHQRGDEQYRALTLVSAKPEPSNQNARNPDATECNTLPFREVATRPQKERPLPPLPPGDMALALQEAKLRRQIRYYAEMHQFYSMQLQQNILDPSDGLEESFDRESFPRMLEGTDLNPLQMDINELLEHSAAFLGDAEPLRQ